MAPRLDAIQDGPSGPVIPFPRPKEAIACPIKASMGLLGKKWTMVVLRDLAFLPKPTFSSILARSPGLTPRVLSFRLREMRAEGLIEKVADARDERVFHYRLTSKGKAALPILTALVAFGMEHLPEKVWADGKPRTLEDVFPRQSERLLGSLYRYVVGEVERVAPESPATALARLARPRGGR
jgi:DNA-binding HxlR family transcriptional regulator